MPSEDMLNCLLVHSLNAEKHQLELTFRSGARAPTSSRLTLSDLSVGQKVEGKVKKVADYGMFIQIDGGNLSGLCHKSQVRWLLTTLSFTNLFAAFG